MKLTWIILVFSAFALAQDQLRNWPYFPFYLNAPHGNLLNKWHESHDGFIGPTDPHQSRANNKQLFEEELERRSMLGNPSDAALARQNIVSPFLRTIFVFTTLTRTLTSRTTCFPSNLFKDATAAANICRRKRRDVLEEILNEKNAELDPTPSFASEQTALASFAREELPDFSSSVMSSKIDTMHEMPGHKIKKRFFSNLFYVPRTITTYTFTTTLLRTTVKPAPTSQLLCRPSDIGLC